MGPAHPLPFGFDSRHNILRFSPARQGVPGESSGLSSRAFQTPCDGALCARALYGVLAMMVKDSIATAAVDTIRCLAMDAVQAANSGHPGTPMAMAPVAYELWDRHLRFDPSAPIWSNRDRFVLSAGATSTPLAGRLDQAGVRAVDPQNEGPGGTA